MRWLAGLAVLIPLLLLLGRGEAQDTNAQVRSTRLKVILPGVETVDVLELEGGQGHAFEIRFKDGRMARMGAEEFAEFGFQSQAERPFWQKILNISSPIGVAWVTLGLLGQLLFTGRMLIQWLASEKAQRSVVPVAFWWMSMGGASMLIAYFIWRKDIIGVLGQSTGWIIYLRNLYFIHREHKPSLG